MLTEFKGLLDFLQLNLSENNFNQLKNLRKPQNAIDTQEFLFWCKKNSNLKINSYEIPSTILKNSKLHDIKISSYGPDDKIYNENREFRLKVARGNSILEINENGKTDYKLVIYALRKFTGGLGDEDDLDVNSNDWKNYFIKDYANIKKVISLRKANGEAAHFSCSIVDDEFLMCAGSKNVHLVFKNKNDLMEFTSSRYSYAQVIAKTIIDFLNGLDPDLKTKFLNFLCFFNLTVIFEILNPNTQHIEDLSHLKEPALMFITFTTNVIDENPSSLCSMTPDCAIQIANVFKLNTVKMEFVDKLLIDDHLSKIRKDHGYEGVVLYFLDSESNVIGLLKKKTTWYIIIRAIREKIRFYISSKTSVPFSDLEQRVKSRLKSIQKWIGFSDNELEKWLTLSMSFCCWLVEKFQKNLISKDDLSHKFPVFWSKFLAETDATDKIELLITKNDNSKINFLNDRLKNISF